MKWFSGKTVLVTGATSGIGREMAMQLAPCGCRLLVCGRDEDAMGSLLEESKAVVGSSIEGFLADLSNKEISERFIEKIKANYEVDILVNNAGFGYMGDFYLMPHTEINSMEHANMLFVAALCRAFIPAMIQKRCGGILNVGSVASFFATPGSALYGATKHFILGFTDAIHEELLSFGVYVTGLYPGHTYSRFIERATQGRRQKWQKAMSASAVAREGLLGLSKNRIRVVPGMGNKLRVFAGSVIPASIILKKIYGSAAKNYKG
jgi:uncharacterized protein